MVDWRGKTFYDPQDTDRSNKNLDKYIYFPFSTIVQRLKIQRNNFLFPKSKSDEIHTLYRMLVSTPSNEPIDHEKKCPSSEQNIEK